MQVTAASTDEQVTELLAALDRLADVVPLRRVQFGGTGRPCRGLSRQRRGKVVGGEGGAMW
jgi:hypothetical protein